MADLGTYGSTYFPMTPLNILPEPGDDITYGWLDKIAGFTQRYLKMATTTQIIANGGTYTFDYSALRNDFFPPVLRAYHWRSNTEGFSLYDPNNPVGSYATYAWAVLPSVLMYTPYAKEYVQFFDIGLSSAKFVNKTGAQGTFLLIGYM